VPVDSFLADPLLLGERCRVKLGLVHFLELLWRVFFGEHPLAKVVSFGTILGEVPTLGRLSQREEEREEEAARAGERERRPRVRSL